MAQKTDYHEGKIGAFVKLIVSLIKKNPVAMEEHDYLMSCIKHSVPDIANKEKCFNCDASMKEYIYQFDAWDALLLIAMAKAVRAKTREGMPFTNANKVLVPTLPVSHAVRCRTTQAAKLGLVAQFKTPGGSRVPGSWVITRRGWAALKGDPVPRRVRVWRKQIEERYEDTITIQQALKSHTDYVETRLRQGRKPKEDHRDEISKFSPNEWYEYGVHEGNIF